MTTLAEFLQTNDAKLLNEEAEREARRQEWLQAVERFLSRIEEWLRLGDPKALLRVQRTIYERREKELGFYRVPGMLIEVATERVEIIPQTRFLKWHVKRDPYSPEEPVQGLVEMTKGSSTDRFFRLTNEAGEEWVVVGSARIVLRPFDRWTFETTLVSLLDYIPPWMK